MTLGMTPPANDGPRQHDRRPPIFENRAPVGHVDRLYGACSPRIVDFNHFLGSFRYAH